MKAFKIISFIILFLHISLRNGHTQIYCERFANEPDPLESVSSVFKNTTGPYYLKVFSHIIRRDNGTGGVTMIQMNDALNLLKSDLNQHNICIIPVGYNYIDNDQFYYGDFFDLYASIFNTNSHSDAIDIYFASDETGRVGGMAAQIPNKSFVYGGNFESYNGPSQVPAPFNLTVSGVISHEMGHCLGLYHTHEHFFCRECPDGSNSLLCGDKVQDTPADPGLYFGNNLTNCNWNCLQVYNVGPPLLICNHPDCNFMPYYPSPTNIMSYAYPTCLNQFTAGQGQRMRDIINTNSLFLPIKVKNIEYIQNQILSESRLYIAVNELYAGKQVNQNQNVGNVVVADNIYIDFKASNSIVLEHGHFTDITYSGSFTAEITDAPFCGFLLNNNKIVNNGNYNKLLDNTQWYYLVHTFDGPIYYLTKQPYDTLINSIVYKKVLSEVVSPTPVAPGILPSHGMIAGEVLLREDSVSKQVFMFNLNTNTEQLLYDFGLSVGDSLPGYNLFGFFVDSIDSVLLNDGLYHKRLTFTGMSPYSIIWIEGVGNLYQPFSASASGTFNPFHTGLICSYQNSNLIYSSNLSNINCQNLLSIDKQSYNCYKLELPIIAGSKSILIKNDFIDCRIKSVFIFDLLGRTIAVKHNLERLNNVQLDYFPVNSSIYLIKIVFEDNSYKLYKHTCR